MKLLMTILACFSTIVPLSAADPDGYSVRYSGGSDSPFTNHSYLKAFVEADKIRIVRGKDEVVIPAKEVTEVSTSEERNSRLGKAALVGLISPGAGMMMALTKARGYYVGIVWNENGKVSGIVLQAKKNNYADLLGDIETLTDKKAISPQDPIQAIRELKSTSGEKKKD